MTEGSRSRIGFGVESLRRKGNIPRSGGAVSAMPDRRSCTALGGGRKGDVARGSFGVAALFMHLLTGACCSGGRRRAHVSRRRLIPSSEPLRIPRMRGKCGASVCLPGGKGRGRNAGQVCEVLYEARRTVVRLDDPRQRLPPWRRCRSLHLSSTRRAREARPFPARLPGSR